MASLPLSLGSHRYTLEVSCGGVQAGTFQLRYSDGLAAHTALLAGALGPGLATAISSGLLSDGDSSGSGRGGGAAAAPLEYPPKHWLRSMSCDSVWPCASPPHGGVSRIRWPMCATSWSWLSSADPPRTCLPAHRVAPMYILYNIMIRAAELTEIPLHFYPFRLRF